MDEYLKVLKKYAVFVGRARRREYWMFALVNTVISLVLAVIDAVVFSSSQSSYGFGVLSGLYTLAVLLPSLAVTVRRLHDTGRSGWWILIGLVPLIGGLIVLIFTVQEGESGGNRYGPSPKGGAPSLA